MQECHYVNLRLKKKKNRTIKRYCALANDLHREVSE